MSYIPEYVMLTVLNRGIKLFRSDNRYIDQLFKNLDQTTLQQLHRFIKNTIDININYPQAPLKFPAIVILLKSETEAQAYLGATMGMQVPEELSYDGNVEDPDVLGGTASISQLSGQGLLQFGPFRAFNGTLNTLNVKSANWPTDQWAGGDFRVSIVAGTGVGQVRIISTNAPNTLMVAANWSIVPDNTSIFEIRNELPEVLGQPSKLYDRRSTSQFIERKGNLLACNYQIQVMSTNQEQTIFLCMILKAIFMLSLTFMESQGLINFKMSATDFTPRIEGQPDYIYMRDFKL